MVEHFLWTALAQIDMIDQIKDLQQKNRSVPSAAAPAQASADAPIKDEMTREEVYVALRCKRSQVWELEKLGLLHSHKVTGRGRCFHGHDVQRVKAMNPEEVSLMIKQQKLKRKALKEKAKRERVTYS
mgnify:CR=1 FL=1